MENTNKIAIGTISEYIDDSMLPVGWLPCDNRELSRTEYKELFKVVGEHYGSGNGKTTFNIPDLKWYAIKCKNDLVPVNKTSIQRIKEIADSMKDLLIYKNEKYGDSALKPNNIFYKGDSTNSILIRLDDKICRIRNNKESTPRVNDVCDIIGYCILLLISLGVTENDIYKLKD